MLTCFFFFAAVLPKENESDGILVLALPGSGLVFVLVYGCWSRMSRGLGRYHAFAGVGEFNKEIIKGDIQVFTRNASAQFIYHFGIPICCVVCVFISLKVKKEKRGNQEPAAMLILIQRKFNLPPYNIQLPACAQAIIIYS